MFSCSLIASKGLNEQTIVMQLLCQPMPVMGKPLGYSRLRVEAAGAVGVENSNVRKRHVRIPAQAGRWLSPLALKLLTRPIAIF
jgi:hypothetical protein